MWPHTTVALTQVSEGLHWSAITDLYQNVHLFISLINFSFFSCHFSLFLFLLYCFLFLFPFLIPCGFSSCCSPCFALFTGVVNGFLSHPVWQPISRLTYSTYLLALPLQSILHYNTSQGGAYYFTHLNTVMPTLSLSLSLSLGEREAPCGEKK